MGRNRMSPKQHIFENAKYIKAQPAPSNFSLYDPLPLFRREFEIDEAVLQATVCLQAPAFAEVYINGQKITKDIFISPVSDYRKILWYNIYDVTNLLQSGKNVIGVLVGNGFFNESFESAWHYPSAAWRDAPQFILRLTVNGHTALVSDRSWKVTKENSPLIYSHLRSGEYVDMRKHNDAWLTAGYDDATWQNAIERSVPITGELRPTCCQPIREAECIEPVSIVPTEYGFLVDFGVTISGYIEITLQADCRSEIRFLYTENVDEAMRPQYNHMNDPRFYPESPFHLDKMIASGSIDTFKPRFCYHGFRYVLIEGAVDLANISLLRAHFIHQDIARRAHFEAKNPVLNFVYTAGIRSTYSNLFLVSDRLPYT